MLSQRKAQSHAVVGKSGKVQGKKSLERKVTNSREGRPREGFGPEQGDAPKSVVVMVTSDLLRGFCFVPA